MSKVSRDVCCILYSRQRWRLGPKQRAQCSCSDALVTFRSRAFIMNALHGTGESNSQKLGYHSHQHIFFSVFFSFLYPYHPCCLYFIRWRRAIRVRPYFNFSSGCIFLFICSFESLIAVTLNGIWLRIRTIAKAWVTAQSMLETRTVHETIHDKS